MVNNGRSYLTNVMCKLWITLYSVVEDLTLNVEPFKDFISEEMFEKNTLVYLTSGFAQNVLSFCLV